MKRIEEEQRRRERLEEERRQREEEALRLAEDEEKKRELEEAQRYVVVTDVGCGNAKPLVYSCFSLSTFKSISFSHRFISKRSQILPRTLHMIHLYMQFIS